MYFNTKKIASIITARGGSKSIHKKNIMKINDTPLLHYPIKAIKESKFDIDCFVNTDCPLIANSASLLDIDNLPRPEYLSGDNINHGDAIIDAADQYEKKSGIIPDIYVILVGNTVMIDGETIDQVLIKLIDDDEASGAMTVWEAADDHPLRALKISRDGHLEEYTKRVVSTNRHSYEKAYFFDCGVWAVKSNFLRTNQGPSPWFWMGPKVIPVERQWITGRDINGPFDVPFHEQWDLLKQTPSKFYY
tara:strand:- start:1114 stop:1857 length:744 start_codon:yes stop_codon:yes gene_type:complete